MAGVLNNSNACVVGNTSVLVGLTHGRRGQLTILRTTLLLRSASPSHSADDGSERKDHLRDGTANSNNHSGDEDEVFILPVPNKVPRGGRTLPQEDAGHYSLELHDVSDYPDVLSVCRESFDLDPTCNREEEAANQAENSLLDSDDNEEDEPEDEEDDATLHSDEDDEEDDDTDDLSDEEAKAFTVGSPAAKQRHSWHRHPLGLLNGERHIPTSYLTFTQPNPKNSGRESEEALDVDEISYNSTEYWDALAGEEVRTPQPQRHHPPQQPRKIYAVQSLKELLHICAYKGENTDKRDDEQKGEEFVDIPLQDNDKDKESEEEFNAEVQRNEQLDDYGSDTEVEFDKEVELELERRRRLRIAKQKRQETNSSNGSSKHSQVDERKYQSFSLSAEARDQLERYSTGYGFIVCLLGTKGGSRINGGTTDADVFKPHSFFRKVSLLLAYTHPAFNGETLHIPFVAHKQPHQHHQHDSALKNATTSLTVYSVNTDVEDGGLSLAQVNRDHYQQQRFKRQNKLRELERDMWEKARQREDKTMLTTKQQQRRANGDNKTAQEDILEEDKMVWFHFGNLLEFFKEGVITEAEYLTRKKQLLESLASNKLLTMESGSSNNDNNQVSAIAEIPPELEHTTRVWKHLRLAKLEVERLPVRMMPLYELRRRHLSSQQLLLFNNKENEGKDSRRPKKEEERVSSKWKLSSANRMLYKAQKLERQKELSKAKELYERILRTQQDHPYAHFAFAKFLSRFRRCKPPEREESGRGSNRERRRYNREEVRRRRMVEAQQQQQQQAIALFERAVKLDPFQGEVLGHYAFFLETVLRDTDKAHRFYKRCLFADPHNLANLCNYAVFLKNVLGENVQAERFYLKAIQLSGGKHVDSLGNYALFLWRVYKSFEDADLYFIKALRQAMDERNYRTFSNNSAKQQKDVRYWRDQYRAFLEETGTRAMGDRQVILLLGKNGRRQQERRKREDEEKSRGDRERGRERRRHERAKESERIRRQRRDDPAPPKRTETNNQVNDAEVGSKHESENAREYEEAKMHRLREEQRLATLQKEEEKINSERTIGRKDKLFISSVICSLWKDGQDEYQLNAKAEEDGEPVEENTAPSSPVTLPPPFTYFCQHRMNEGTDGKEENIDATSKTAPEVIARMERLLERQGARKHLCSVLNDQRTNTMEIAAEAFPVLCRFLWVALHHCDTQMDFTSAKECMHMACTFYTVISSNSNSNSSGDSDGNESGRKDSSQQNTKRTMMESLRRFYSSMDTRKNGDDGEKKQEEGERSDNNKLYIQDTLKAAAIWNNEDYWSTAFYEQMFYERNKLGLIVTGSGSWSGSSEEERSDLLKTEENITFGLLGSFSHNMMMAGIPKTKVMSFISKQCLANGLDECRSAPLLELISSWPSQ
ncbi:Histone acetyltransferase GCN5 [Balamuthia mandrillaris]